MPSRKLDAHIFICTNEREDGHPRGCCKAKNSQEVLDAFKKELIDRGLKPKMRAQRAGCLDVCEDGASIVIYPQNLWLGKVTPEDVPEILDCIVEEKPMDPKFRVPGK